ncbi:efflux RND transporter permease subunit [bacterium]|nr:efflux RND transporter permease subunit [bacterium]
MFLSDLSIRRPVLATMMTGSIVVFGLVSYNRLGVDLFPDVEFPIVTITTILEGADPETVETTLTDVIEEHVNTISGIKRLNSQSSEGVSLVVIELQSGRGPGREGAGGARQGGRGPRRPAREIEPPSSRKWTSTPCPSSPWSCRARAIPSAS